LAATLYVLSTAAGITRRGRQVAWSSLIGATCQIGSVAILVPLVGIVGFGFGAVIGRIAALGILSRAVSDMAPLSASFAWVLAAAVGIIAWIQVLAADASETLFLRLGIVGLTLALGAVALAWFVRGPRPGELTEGAAR
jgi:hypothetical protein